MALTTFYYTINPDKFVWNSTQLNQTAELLRR